MLAGAEGKLCILETEMWIRDVSFRKSSVWMTDTGNAEIRFPYRELVAAYLEVREKETGRLGHPDMAKVTEELEGSLVLLDRQFRRIRIHPVGRGKTAGTIFKQLAIHAPYLFLEYMPWMDQGDMLEFCRIQEMVAVMRSVSEGAMALL